MIFKTPELTRADVPIAKKQETITNAIREKKNALNKSYKQSLCESGFSREEDKARYELKLRTEIDKLMLKLNELRKEI